MKDIEMKSGIMAGSKIRRVAAVAGALALLASSVSPAAARGYGGGGYGWGNSGWNSGGYGGWGGRDRYRHRRDRGLNGGEILGIAALLGAVAVVATSASKNKKAATVNNGRYPDDRPYDANRDGVDNRDYGNYSNDDYSGERYSGASMSADQAADACAVAVRDKVEGEQGGYAQIVNVTEPRSAGQDGWAVDGRVERRSGYRETGGEVRRFSCDVQGSQVAEVYISRDVG